MRVAICVDAGAPSQLLRDALTIGRLLTERNHSVTYTVGDPLSLVDYGCTSSDLYQAPNHRSAPSLVMKRPREDGLADRFASAGFDDKQTLTTLATIWDRQLSYLKPDVIVGFYSPVLWLVAPAHAPTFALGYGAMLPPVLGTSFARLSAESSPLASEERMLTNANAVLARLGQPSLLGISEVLERCTSILYGVPAFDPYLTIRTAHSSGLFGEAPMPLVPPAKQHLVAFLDIYCPGIETVILALAGLHEMTIDVCVTGATPTMRSFLAQQPHIKLWKDYVSLLDQVGKATIVIHHGEQDVAQRCFAIGRPQFILPSTKEQENFGYAIGWMGFAWTKDPNTPIEDLAGAIRAFTDDAAVVVSAQHHARQLAKVSMPDASPEIINRIEQAGQK